MPERMAAPRQAALPARRPAPAAVRDSAARDAFVRAVAGLGAALAARCKLTSGHALRLGLRLALHGEPPQPFGLRADHFTSLWTAGGSLLGESHVRPLAPAR
jgi:hypothetical protein